MQEMCKSLTHGKEKLKSLAIRSSRSCRRVRNLSSSSLLKRKIDQGSDFLFPVFENVVSGVSAP